MAHDPTRAWPLGIGPDQTAIPGAAWLELLDGQAFPVVGAGAMVWNGTMWVPVSTQNRLPVDAVVSGTVDVSDRADRQLGKVALTGRDVETGNAEPLSVVRDPNGNYVLRVVESAPVAYDKGRDELRTKSSNSRAELIHSAWTGLHIGNSVVYVGINVGTASASITPIDVSDFKDKLVVIKNEYDQGAIAVRVRGHRSLDAGANGSEGTILDEVISSDDDQTVEAGSTLVLDTADWPKMARPYIGFTLRLQRIAPAPTSGRIVIDIFGRGI